MVKISAQNAVTESRLDLAIISFTWNVQIDKLELIVALWQHMAAWIWVIISYGKVLSLIQCQAIAWTSGDIHHNFYSRKCGLDP